MPAIASPLPQFFDLDGDPLEAGYVHIGTAGGNPETAPVPVYWDAALTQPAVQPLRTSRGYIARSGSPAAAYVAGSYSLTAKRSNGVRVLYAPTSDQTNESVALRSDLASTASGKGAELIGFLASGSGAVARTVDDKLKDIASVTDFGADSTGATDSTAAINAAIAYLASKSVKELVFPAGIFLISSALTPLTGSNWTVRGAGQHSTIIRSTANDRIFASDARTAEIYWHEYHDMTLERVSGTPYESSVGIVVLGDTGSVTGLQYATFAGLRFNNLYRGIVVQDTGKYTSGAFVNNTRHGFFVFKDLVSAFSTNAMYECVVFEGGTGPHHTFIGGQIRGSNAAIRLGTAGGDAGIGDLTFVGLHVVTAGVGLDVYGPTGGTTYDQNLTVAGCQFDNCSTATVRMDKMQNCRIALNNSTSVVGVTLTNCTNIVREDRNAFTFQNVSMEGTLTTTLGGISDTNGTRIYQRAAFRRSAADSSLLLTGGTLSTVGARLELFGQSHATTPDTASVFADRFALNNDAATVNYLDASETYVRIGDGAWNGTPLRLGAYYLWVDSTGDLRIKSGAPASDTDGAIVGVQS